MKNKFLESRWILQSNEPSMLMETRPHFTHLEMSPLSMKGCIFWPMLGTYGHWAVRVLYSLPHLLRHGSSPRIHDTYTYSRLFGCGAVKTCFNDLGLSRLGLNSQPYACAANTINHCTTAALYTKHFEQKHVWTNCILLAMETTHVNMKINFEKSTSLICYAYLRTIHFLELFFNVPYLINS